MLFETQSSHCNNEKSKPLLEFLLIRDGCWSFPQLDGNYPHQIENNTFNITPAARASILNITNNLS